MEYVLNVFLGKNHDDIYTRNSYTPACSTNKNFHRKLVNYYRTQCGENIISNKYYSYNIYIRTIISSSGKRVIIVYFR